MKTGILLLLLIIKVEHGFNQSLVTLYPILDIGYNNYNNCFDDTELSLQTNRLFHSIKANFNYPNYLLNTRGKVQELFINSDSVNNVEYSVLFLIACENGFTTYRTALFSRAQQLIIFSVRDTSSIKSVSNNLFANQFKFIVDSLGGGKVELEDNLFLTSRLNEFKYQAIYNEYFNLNKEEIIANRIKGENKTEFCALTREFIVKSIVDYFATNDDIIIKCLSKKINDDPDRDINIKKDIPISLKLVKAIDHYENMLSNKVENRDVAINNFRNAFKDINDYLIDNKIEENEKYYKNKELLDLIYLLWNRGKDIIKIDTLLDLGDKLLRESDLHSAESMYGEVLANKYLDTTLAFITNDPNSEPKYSNIKLFSIDQIDTISQLIKKGYSKCISSADSLFNKKKYVEAMENYLTAYSYGKQISLYPLSRYTKCVELLNLPLTKSISNLLANDWNARFYSYEYEMRANKPVVKFKGNEIILTTMINENAFNSWFDELNYNLGAYTSNNNNINYRFIYDAISIFRKWDKYLYDFKILITGSADATPFTKSDVNPPADLKRETIVYPQSMDLKDGKLGDFCKGKAFDLEGNKVKSDLAKNFALGYLRAYEKKVVLTEIAQSIWPQNSIEFILDSIVSDKRGPQYRSCELSFAFLISEIPLY